jgi:hypothetical protein
MPLRPNWQHDREHFYKYMTAGTAKIVLGNSTLRWSSPATFNDPFDVQFDLHLEYDPARVEKEAMLRIWEVYSGERALQPGNPLGALLLAVRDRVPGLSRQDLYGVLMGAVAEGIARGAAALPQVQEDFRRQLCSIKVLCLSETYENILMWSHYASDHTGVALRFSCVPDLDSAWGAAKPMRYTKRMPRLMDEREMIDLLWGAGGIDTQDLLERAVYSKAQDWSYEREWRVFGGDGRDPRNLYDDYRFNPRELTAVYFGCRAAEANKGEAIALLADQYPHAEVYQAVQAEREFSLEFVRIS